MVLVRARTLAQDQKFKEKKKKPAVQQCLVLETHMHTGASDEQTTQQGQLKS